jgi:hypothetical protein
VTGLIKFADWPGTILMASICLGEGFHSPQM